MLPGALNFFPNFPLTKYAQIQEVLKVIFLIKATILFFRQQNYVILALILSLTRLEVQQHF